MADYPVIRDSRGEEIPWTGLRLESHMANTTEDIDRNIEYSLGRKYIGYQELIGTESGAVSVVGSGPSLKENWHKLRDFDGDIITCNAACQFLLEKGIVPKYWFCFDADPLMLEFITPRSDITYLLASRCPPKAWELLEGCKVVCWHAMGDLNLQAILEKHRLMEPMVVGGSAAVTRAMILTHSLGYKSVHLWGVDSSFHNGDTHIRQSTTVEKWIPILCNKQVFDCAPWMAQQAEDFKILAPSMRDELGMKLVVHGYGLIPHLAKAMKFEVDDESKATQFWRHAKTKAGILWSQL